MDASKETRPRQPPALRHINGLPGCFGGLPRNRNLLRRNARHLSERKWLFIVLSPSQVLLADEKKSASVSKGLDVFWVNIVESVLIEGGMSFGVREDASEALELNAQQLVVRQRLQRGIPVTSSAPGHVPYPTTLSPNVRTEALHRGSNVPTTAREAPLNRLCLSSSHSR
jgi:hypothetical protein